MSDHYWVAMGIAEHYDDTTAILAGYASDDIAHCMATPEGDACSLINRYFS
jgi:hypothetical protein